MLYQVTPMRSQGVSIPQGLIKRAPAAIGELRISDMTETNQHRAIRVATLRSPSYNGAGPDLLPQLFDVVIVAMGHDWFTLSGIERLRPDGRTCVDFAQSWLVKAPAP